MFVRREFEWLKRRFREYDLVYLDPLVCNPALRKSGLSRWAFWRSSEEKAIASFLGQLIETLGITPKDASPSSFLEDKGLGTRFKSDRILQRRAAHVINQYLAKDELEARHHYIIASLQRQKTSLEKIADRPNGDSLIIVDAMFATRAKAPEEIQRAVQAPVQYQDNSARTIECVLTDSPGPLLTLHDPVIGLRVDGHAFYNWTEAFNTILSAGWYPFARAVGLYATSPGGHPFIKVIAILMRPYPSLDEVLAPPLGESPRCCLPGMLEYVLENSLNPEIDKLQDEKKKEGRGTKRKTRATSAGTGAVTSLKRVYDRDEQFLFPVYLFQLCCQLNRTSYLGLQVRANRAYQVLRLYLERLKVLGECLKNLEIESQIVSQETDVRKLLPEPELRGRRELVPSRR